MSNEQMVSVPRASPVRSHIHGCEDRREDGQWIKTWRTRTASEIITNHSRASGLWSKVERRSQAGGMFQRANPAYVGTTNTFRDFQEFADWCNSQPGYMSRDSSGNPWEIDKDILVKGSKVYSRDTCCFVPRRINSMFTSCRASRGEHPIGVSFIEKRNKYRAYCNSDGRLVHLGHYDNSSDAHRAWQNEKIKVIVLAADEYLSSKGSDEKVYLAIISRAALIADDVDYNRITVEV